MLSFRTASSREPELETLPTFPGLPPEKKQNPNGDDSNEKFEIYLQPIFPLNFAHLNKAIASP
tara:strand:- start:250 stop:438 length:189 start_codon:yes stop_codon:yes gene_type:complete